METENVHQIESVTSNLWKILSVFTYIIGIANYKFSKIRHPYLFLRIQKRQFLFLRSSIGGGVSTFIPIPKAA
jgi:hypothetical protein